MIGTVILGLVGYAVGACLGLMSFDLLAQVWTIPKGSKAWKDKSQILWNTLASFAIVVVVTRWLTGF